MNTKPERSERKKEGRNVAMNLSLAEVPITMPVCSAVMPGDLPVALHCAETCLVV